MTVKSTEFRITAEGWHGIFLSEEEAALAMAGRGLPERVLDHRQVSDKVRTRCAEDPEYRAEFLAGRGDQIHIARWKLPENGIREMDRGPHVEITRERYWNKEELGDRIPFRTSFGGRTYSAEETSLMIDALQLAYRLMALATGHIENRKLARKLSS